MITGIIIGIFLIIAGIKIVSAISQDSTKGLMTGIAIAVVGVIIAFIQPYSVEKIDSGYKGLKISLIGSQRGVTNYQYKTGWVVYNSWTEQVKEFPLFQQHIEYDDQVVITKGGFSATIKPTFNYSLKETNIGDMFVNLRLDTKSIEQGWLKNAIVGAVNDEANKWEVDSIFSHRQEFEAAIVVECNKRLTRWFDVSQLRTNITPPEALQEAIISKTKAIQQAEASEQQALTAIAEGKRKVAVARADSAETIINAKAAALAIKLKQMELTPMFIEYIKATNWDGVLPTTVAGGAGTFLNVK
ncbi:Band 7 domain containing protein [uncultured Caudovirales phage]|uniref:Band 7 domain containing protein n=1 Tax=uncultured Caudovirales phage TaxID=2100421 RepID=A0A6J5PM78_9CAUD|nr:Band 7 domain containing protein [uncultured Caudovirales phage]CAB4170461.1 Band 7 domain containing protein [uncultured Caudovirales phage]CAB4198607.1 Band 7 domain containing protein [uncultured Caudovirales phage]